MKIYFLRHGQSEYNVYKKINTDPRIKVPLTQLGKKQAERIGKKLAKKKFDIIFVSEFYRAKQTAKIINKFLNRKIKVDSRLNEANIGFEGETDLKFKKLAGKNIETFKLKNRESFKDVVSRIKKFLIWLKKQKYDSVLIVSHEWVLKAVNKIKNNLSLRKAYARRFKNCEVITLKLK